MANYTKKAILSNFEQMLIEMPFDKITVSALVERSEISSNTFYYHFRDIYDLLDVWLAEQKKVFFEEVEDAADWTSCLKTALKKLRDHPKIVYHVFDSLSRERIEQFVFVVLEKEFYSAIKESVGNLSVSEETLQDLSAFCCFSTFGFFMKYLWDHMNAEIDESVDRISKTFDGVIEYVIRKSKEENP